MKIYKIICLIYSYIFFIFEKLFIENKSFNNKISNLGMQFIKLRNKKHNFKDPKKIIKFNNYHYKYIYEENLINKINTVEILKGKIALSSSPKKLFTTKKDEGILLMKPNICFHRAGIPSKRKYTKLIMLQLNPSKSWKISKDLYKRQYKNEPKFTNIANFFTKKIRL